jgi:hypothetical protein
MMRFLLSMTLMLGACIPAGDSAEFKFAAQTDSGITITDTGATNNGSNADGGNTSTQMPDASPDLPEDMSCVSESTEALCVRLAVECGSARGVDNCMQSRDISCGSCVFGTGCASGECIETECRDDADNDGDGMVDCADSDCADQRCSSTDDSRLCRNDGGCR